MHPRTSRTCPLVAALLLLPACVTSANGPSTGLLCTFARGPISVADPGPLPADPRIGTAESHSSLFFTYGDASIEAAMKNGDITRVHHVDYEIKSILGLFTEYTTIVVGE